MTISIYAVGRFKEVVFLNADNEDVRATSGLLDEVQAAELAERLRAVADNLSDAKRFDDNQAVLPFYPTAASPGIFFTNSIEDRAATG